MKMSILSKACIVPGFSTLLTNLVRSYSPEDYTLSTTSWQQEYRMFKALVMTKGVATCCVDTLIRVGLIDYGSAHEIYATELPIIFDGSTFAEAAQVWHGRAHY
jgi:hypothetical protein